MDIAVLGIDLGKNSCSLVGLDSSGKVILRRRMQRKTIVSLASKALTLHRCNGSLLRRPSSGASSFGPGTHSSAYVA